MSCATSLGFIHSFVRVLVLVPLYTFSSRVNRAMNIASSSTGRRPHESVDWTSSDPPKLPKHWAHLLPLSMTHEVELWGTSLLALLVKELVIRYSAMSDPSAHDIVVSEKTILKQYLILVVQELAGMKKSPDKAAARTWIRNFFAFVFEEYGFGGARAWARHLFEARIKEICKDRKVKERKYVLVQTLACQCEP